MKEKEKEKDRSCRRKEKVGERSRFETMGDGNDALGSAEVI